MRPTRFLVIAIAVAAVALVAFTISGGAASKNPSNWRGKISPDLLDQMDLETDTLLAVDFQAGVTRIAPIDKASRSIIRDHLYTPGELLRMDQIEPDREDLARQASSESRSEEKES